MACMRWARLSTLLNTNIPDNFRLKSFVPSLRIHVHGCYLYVFLQIFSRIKVLSRVVYPISALIPCTKFSSMRAVFLVWSIRGTGVSTALPTCCFRGAKPKQMPQKNNDHSTTWSLLRRGAIDYVGVRTVNILSVRISTGGVVWHGCSAISRVLLRACSTQRRFNG